MRRAVQGTWACQSALASQGTTMGGAVGSQRPLLHAMSFPQEAALQLTQVMHSTAEVTSRYPPSGHARNTGSSAQKPCTHRNTGPQRGPLLQSSSRRQGVPPSRVASGLATHALHSREARRAYARIAGREASIVSSSG